MLREDYRPTTILRYTVTIRLLSKNTEIFDADKVKDFISKSRWSEGTDLTCNAYIYVRPYLCKALKVYYSKITKKGQTTIPVRCREKYGMKEGAIVTFKETDDGLLIVPMPDITDSAGALSRYADSEVVLSDLLKTRKENFR